MAMGHPAPAAPSSSRPGNRLGDHWSGRDNNFNLLRLVAATLVLVSHSFAISLQSGAAEPFRSSLGLSLGELAVDIFFAASGFLVTASLFTRRDVIEFAAARGLRIFPGLWVSLALTVLVFGFCFTSLAPSAFFSEWQTWRFTIKNAILVRGVEWTLPGFPHAVNGSLWTLPSEIAMYALLAGAWVGLWFLRDRRVGIVSALCIAAALLGVVVDLGMFLTDTPTDFWRLLAKFFCGAALYVARDRIPATRAWFIGVVVLLALSAFDKTAFGVVYRCSIAYLTLYLALVPAGRVRLFNRVGDFSYGMYIYAFPVQIVLYHLWPQVGPLRMLVISFAITWLFAYGSWHLVEERSLRLKGAFQRWRKAGWKRGPGALPEPQQPPA
jgi:peptidoglycan/LPS O-acetylase OafA/YrhL